MGELLEGTPLLVAVTWRSLAVGLILLFALRFWARGAATSGHRLYAAAVLTMLTLPIACACLPILEVPMLPGGLGRELGGWERAPESPPVSSASPSADVEAAIRSGSVLLNRPRPSLNLGRWFSAIYLLGAAVFVFRLLLGAGSLSRMRAASRPLPRASIPDCLRQDEEKKPLDVRVSAAVGSPLIFGLARPTILLPSSWCDWPASTFRAALVHEVMHARRNDHLWTSLSAINRCVHWFNPLSWILHRRLVASAEHATDQLSLALFEDPIEYARALLDAKTRFASVAHKTAVSCSMFDSNHFMERIDRVLSRPGAPARRSVNPVAAGLLAACLLGSVQPVVGWSAVTTATSERPAERARALALLAGSDRSQGAVSALVQALGDDRRLEEVAAWKLEFDGWQPAHSYWTHPSPGSVAALTLASFGRDAIGVLAEASQNRDPVVRRHAVWALGELRRPHVGVLPLTEVHLESIRWRLDDSDDEVRAAAAWTLGEHRNRDATESLIERLTSDSSLKVRSFAAFALGEIQARSARSQLERAARSSSPTLRHAARTALGELDG